MIHRRKKPPTAPTYLLLSSRLHLSRYVVLWKHLIQEKPEQVWSLHRRQVIYFVCFYVDVGGRPVQIFFLVGVEGSLE